MDATSFKEPEKLSEADYIFTHINSGIRILVRQKRLVWPKDIDAVTDKYSLSYKFQSVAVGENNKPLYQGDEPSITPSRIHSISKEMLSEGALGKPNMLKEILIAQRVQEAIRGLDYYLTLKTLLEEEQENGSTEVKDLFDEFEVSENL